MHFPDGFKWGASTSAYQIEGGHDSDGKGPSIWDEFCRKPGVIKKGLTGDVACDHYHRFRQDISLMQRIGLNAYRFSVAWSRILPEGKGTPNAKGLEFYDQLVDGLLEAGIDPWVTLYHWDLPAALDGEDGWLNPDSPKWFADYAGLMATRLGDRVRNWMTFNEQTCFLVGGYLDGWHAPGRKEGWSGFLLANKHVQLAHGLACQGVRSHSPKPARLGMAPCSIIGIPATESPRDIEAARSFTFDYRARNNWHTSLYLEPNLRGVWPEDVQRILGDDAPPYTDEDLKTMHQPLDFLGLNFYQASHIRMSEDNLPEEAPARPGNPPAGQYWGVTPDGLYWSVRFHAERYGIPSVITENGISLPDWVALDGGVHDLLRIDYLHRYLLQLKRAMKDGFAVEGYFQWSLMDNFEWGEGYTQRFGLIHVDFETQERTLKDSASWYGEVIRSNGRSLFKPNT